MQKYNDINKKSIKNKFNQFLNKINKFYIQILLWTKPIREIKSIKQKYYGSPLKSSIVYHV